MIDRDTGLPVEPMDEPFGIVWERFWKFRRGRGEGWLLSLWRSWCDTRAVRP
jgi:hypothetical protein